MNHPPAIHSQTGAHLAVMVRDAPMTASQSSIEIGRRLTVAKATLPHGQFIPWVTATFGFGPTMTQCSTASTSSPTTSRARVRVDLLGEVERPLARRKAS